MQPAEKDGIRNFILRFTKAFSSCSFNFDGSLMKTESKSIGKFLTTSLSWNKLFLVDIEIDSLIGEKVRFCIVLVKSDETALSLIFGLPFPAC